MVPTSQTPSGATSRISRLACGAGTPSSVRIGHLAETTSDPLPTSWVARPRTQQQPPLGARPRELSRYSPFYEIYSKGEWRSHLVAFYDVPLGEHSTEYSFSPLLVYDRGSFPYAIPEGAACSCFGGCPLSLFFSSVRKRYLRGALGLSDLLTWLA